MIVGGSAGEKENTSEKLFCQVAGVLPRSAAPRAVVSDISGTKKSLPLRAMVKTDLSYLTNHQDDELLSSLGKVSGMIENSLYRELPF